ncbi:MAG: Dabb family protein [Clostridiales bacterium]|nr:Dabb family protein [Clostridiales bacterium]
MVKHIVMWTLKDEQKANAEKIAGELQGKFKSLLGVVEGLTAIEIGQNYNGGNYDIVLYCEFTNRETQDAYQNHPAHVAIKGRVHELTCARECVDYEI